MCAVTAVRFRQGETDGSRKSALIIISWAFSRLLHIVRVVHFATGAWLSGLIDVVLLRLTVFFPKRHLEPRQ